ncbi:hypothetical protein B484DRAFT_330537, partial [Ochromonadaceae sp. CCMP2298]
GHTFGHAIEAGLGYGAWLHGEAVGTGMMMAADMSHSMGLIDTSVLARTEKLLVQAGLPAYEAKVASLGTARFLDLMSFDKKVADGKLSLVLLKGPLGGSVITDVYDAALLQQTVEKYCNSR